MGNAASEHEKKGKPAGSVPQSDLDPVLVPALRTDRPLSEQEKKEGLVSLALSKSEEEEQDMANYEHSMEEDKDKTAQLLRTIRPLSEQEKKEGREEEEEEMISYEESSEEEEDLNDSLYWAAGGGSVEEVRELISKGAEVDYKTDWLLDLGKTPLYTASENGHSDVVSLLLSHRADPNITDSYGRSPLHIADNVQTADLLLSNGASITAVTPDGNSVLHTAENVEVAKYLVEKGASLESRNKNEETVLHTIEEGEVAKYFIEKEVSVESRNKKMAARSNEGYVGENQKKENRLDNIYDIILAVNV